VSPVRKFISPISQRYGDLEVSSPSSKVVTIAASRSFSGAQL
jgi:hypothetical protein